MREWREKEKKRGNRAKVKRKRYLKMVLIFY